MKKVFHLLAMTIATSLMSLSLVAEETKKPEPIPYVAPKDSCTEGKVSVRGKTIAYHAIAATLIVTQKDKDLLEPTVDPKDAPQTSMFYVAYFKKDENAAKRPLVFLYNGGPGSASLWLHMGSFGPVRISTNNDTHTPPAPYQLVANDNSLLDVADLVFIDAPGTGFSRIMGKDKEKAFLGIDADASAFSRFISQFLTKHKRWNSPKYLFGESYGTTRSAVVARMLQQDHSVDLNGVILLSQILDFSTDIDSIEFDPGNQMPFVLALPSYAAVAWYHKMLPEQPAKLEDFLPEVERFAEREYAPALAAGHMLADSERKAIVAKLHQYTGLPEAYIEKANLRVHGGEFEEALQIHRGIITGRLDARFAGPADDLLDKEAAYDPFASSIGPAYVAALNNYVRETLKFGEDQPFRPSGGFFPKWEFRHLAPGNTGFPISNVLPDLAMTMKRNPLLKVLNLAGYYDLATPYYAAKYELRHLPIPADLRKNVESIVYPSGHMIYAHLPSLTKLHDDVAKFIGTTSAK